jgi:site-specific DNA-methyltransferase (adenine-specific)/modification methylase
VTPYYADGQVALYLADCAEVLPLLSPETVDLVLTDPPYGISEATNRRERQRTALALCNDFPPLHGDDAPFDPAPLLRFRRLVLFGANHYADRLPPAGGWIVWDKRAGLMSKRGDAFNDNGDAELAWTNLGGPVRVYSHLWLGMLKASERDERRVHPTQKPVAVMRRIIQEHTDPGDMVLDPYAGSGPTLRAAKDLGRRAIGIEIYEPYAEIAARRLAQGVLPLEVEG